MGEIYLKEKKKNYKKYIKSLGILIFICGLLVSFYIFSPLLLWQFYSAPKLTSANIETPVPRNIVLNPSLIQTLMASAKNSISGVDYTNAQNWFPGFRAQANTAHNISYTISIPSINIKNAEVSASDYDLTKHLINYQGTAVPPNNGNAVIFGHSTLPALYDPTDYKTIFANALNLKNDDEIIVNFNGVIYKYKIFNIYPICFLLAKEGGF